MYLSLLVVFVEVLLITLLNYEMVGSHISLDVLYCLPILQAARAKVIHNHRTTASPLPYVIGAAVALIWSFAEAWVSVGDFPIFAFCLNTFTRGITLGVLGKVVSRLWKEREYGYKDSLTNLSNRVELVTKLEYTQSISERSGKPYSLLYIDVDRFKQLNDDRGHQAGDDALCKIAAILKSSARETDTIARIGGDEFVVLFPDADAEECDILHKRIQRSAEEEFNNNGWDIALSMGHVTGIGKARSAMSLLDEADTNMYATKRAKRIE